MKKHLWPVCFGSALALFSVYCLLDTFVIPTQIQTNATEVNISMFDEIEEDLTMDETTAEATTEAVAIEEVYDYTIIGTYSNDYATIVIKEYYVNDTAIYVADVQLTSARYLETALAGSAYGKNVTDTTSDIAEDNDAVLAINGDYYGAQERGYVIRNGVVYRSKKGSADVLCIYADGSMEVVDPDDHTAEELVEMGVWQAFSFGPGLIEDGEITVTSEDEVGKAKSSNPRTAIGVIENNHYVFVVADGRTDESEGLTLLQLAEFMETLGVTTAYNLDGGGSSTMYFNGEVINNPTTSGNRITEREVSDIVYIGY